MTNEKRCSFRSLREIGFCFFLLMLNVEYRFSPTSAETPSVGKEQERKDLALRRS